ncbi:MICOS complex subunit Mic60-like isoform X1 [Helicoverpa zea]|uniref:MICOS complex subunit Mic60-like isoform X1 n=1 Tax=Helicoverpa zea TaxID=7113 RepID=UPI001F583BC4|nr:MICOS complex subunit Mic60-like isoform X1 [Helicoverpa zea]
MLKFTNSLTNAKLVLVRRHMSDGSCAALIVMRNPHRRYATEQKPDPSCRAPPEAPKSHKLFWGAIGATILTGAAVVYAKNSPRTRNWLESNAPWANDLVALVYQENTTYWKAASNQFNRTTTYLGEFLFGKEGVTPTELKNRSDQDIEKDAEEHFSKKSYQLPPPLFEPLYVEEKPLKKPEVDSNATLIQTDKCEPQTTVVIKITKDMVELEHDMHENVKIAIDNYKLATSFCDEYNKALFKIVETSVDDLEKKHYSGLAGLNVQKENAAKKAREASAKAKLALETLDRMIKSGQMQAPPESLATTKRYIKQFRADLTSAEDTYAQELAKSSLSEKYWNKVEAARGMFREELQALFPGIDLCAKKLDIKGDVDLLLAYTLQKVQYLQNQLAELQTVRDLKINRAIECNDEKALIEAKAEDIIRNERSAMEAEYLKKSIQIQSEANRQTKEALKKQMELQQEVMQARLAKREQEMMANFARAVSEEVEAERVEFKKELAAMAGKLKAIEDTLKQRSGAEAEARRSQSLWTAAEALLAATRRSVPDTKVDNELKALEKAGKDDKLVETVLKGIPPDVREKGIVTEKALRERFEKMEQTAVKVALVGRDGATLPVYFMSWLQSLLLFKKFSDIPKDELDNKPTDFTQLDTFDIMQRARYHMDHGNLPAALRYVNLLQGAPRAAARAWADAARRHLEIRQAAEAVMAHASVSSLLYH